MSWWQRAYRRLWRDRDVGSNLPSDADRSDEAAEFSDPEIHSEELPEAVSLEITDVLDLHPFAPREVPAVVEAYLEEARAKGYTSVRIVHGKGTGVQRARVHSILKRTPFVASFSDAPLGGGSWGATVVWFKG